ncbi:MAG TPA: TIM-barrel domain-containing protein [Casimicrobiaceae bacterium]|nr:TIM-barrel domain-containing protein [Casimicrobiaceae bacterium]
MRLDSSDYLPIDASSSLGASASGASFATSTGDMLEIGSFGPGIFRLRVGPNTRPDYGLIAARAQRCDVAQPSRGLWTFTAGDGSLELAGTPLTLRLMHAGKTVLASITDRTRGGKTRLPAIGRARQGQSWVAAYALASGEPVYGLGAQAATLNKRGQLVDSQVEAAGASPFASGTSAPFCWSPGPGGGAWGIYVHTPSRVLHGVGYPGWSQRSYGLVVDDEALDLFLIAARDPAQVIERYTALTGRAPEVPRWSLGVWIARDDDSSADDAVAAASDLRARRVPCDVLTLDGAAPWDRWTSFDFRWDPRRYPDPAGALARIRQHGFKVGVCEEPAISIHSPLFHDLAARKYLMTDADGRPYERAGGTAPDDAPAGAQLAPPTGIVDLTNPAAYAWWRNAHEALFKAGVDVIEAGGGDDVPADAIAFNGDTGQRVANVYPLLYGRCVFDAAEKFAPAEQAPPLIWSGAGWTGSQRYPVQSGGETQSDWEGLAASIRASLSSGMSGVPYRACEVGGGYGGEPASAELYLRWLQAGVFASHLKLRAGGGRDPWPLDADQEKIALQWLEFRYRLLPYLGTVVAQAARTGLPVMRAMPLAFPGNALTRAYDMQFMCGDALLVAPVIAAGGEVDVALPPGAWYDLATRQRVAGRQVIRYRATLDRVPVFGREGHALPLGPAVQHTGEVDSENPLNALWVFGKPAHALDGFAQAGIALAADGAIVSATSGVQVEVFGDSTGVRVEARG